MRQGSDTVAWATLLINNQTGAEDQSSRQQFAGDLVNRLEIIPNDGLGFAPGSNLTLQMFSRSPMLQGFPYPPSSVSVDGQALTTPYLRDIPVAEIRIHAISNATEFSPPEFATVTSSLFQGVVELVPGATQTLGLFTRSLDAAGHPASPLVYVDTAPALGAAQVTIGLEPPAVRSGHGMIEVWDSDRLDHWDYAFYDWQPPWRIVSPSDGDDQQLRDEVVVQIVVPESDVTEFYFVGGTGVFVEAGATSATAVADLSFGWSTFMLEGDNLVPLDARTIRIHEDVIGMPVKAWRMCDDQGGTVDACNNFGLGMSSAEIRSLVDNLQLGNLSTYNSVDDIWTQANIQFRLKDIGIIADTALANQVTSWDTLAQAGIDNGAFNVYLFNTATDLFGTGRSGVATIGGVQTVVKESSDNTYVVAHEVGHLLCLQDLYIPDPNCPGDLSDRLMCCWGCTVLENDQIAAEITDARSCSTVSDRDENDD